MKHYVVFESRTVVECLSADVAHKAPVRGVRVHLPYVILEAPFRGVPLKTAATLERVLVKMHANVVESSDTPDILPVASEDVALRVLVLLPEVLEQVLKRVTRTITLVTFQQVHGEHRFL